MATDLILKDQFEIVIIEIPEIRIAEKHNTEGEAFFPCTVWWTTPPLVGRAKKREDIIILDVLKVGIIPATYTKLYDNVFRKKKNE